MNKILETAIARLVALPDDQQEAYGHQLLDELEDERGWDERFAKTQDLLGVLAEQAMQDVAKGDVLPFDPSNQPKR